MSDKPILFSSAMVRAILAGEKSMTRRVLKYRISERCVSVRLAPNCAIWQKLDDGTELVDLDQRPGTSYQVGDRLWVRETWEVEDHDFGNPPTAWLLRYLADDSLAWKNPPIEERQGWADKFGTADTHGGPDPKRRPSIHMPRWASRITLEVTGVKVERLDIHTMPLADAQAEGFKNAVEFFVYWDKLNRKRGFGAEARPWVGAYTFSRVEEVKRG